MNEATKERDLREERAGVMATAWRMRAENGEADAENAKKALAGETLNPLICLTISKRKSNNHKH